MNRPVSSLLGVLYLAVVSTAFPALATGDGTSSTKLILLPDLVEPQTMRVDESRIFIAENHKIFVYSSDNYRLLKRFGRVGEEPDAFRRAGQRRLRPFLDVGGDNLLVSSHERVSLFSKDGMFESVVTESPQVDYLAALGSKYVASAYVIEVGTGKSYQHAVLFDDQMEFVEKIAESHLGGGSAKGFGGPDRKMHIDLVPHHFGFAVYDDRIYVGNSFEGFFIEVFDSTGKSLYKIEHEYDKQPVPADYAREWLAKIEEYPSYQRYRESTVIDEPEYLPAFRSFTVSAGRIYVFTHRRRDGEQEVVVLDLEGNHLNTVYLPRADCHRIHDGKYYYTELNKDDEWELRVAVIDAGAGKDDNGE